jgi:hypothetical protein
MPLAVTLRESRSVHLTSIFPDDQPVTIGRSSQCSLVVSEAESRLVSRVHATLYRKRDGSWMLRDEDSKHGTFVSDRRVTGEARLDWGSSISLGRGGPAVSVTWSEGAPPYGQRFTPSPVPFPLALEESFLGRHTRYEVVGAGRYGMVWRARPDVGAPWTAVKILEYEARAQGDPSDTRERLGRLRRRFTRELELSRRLARLKLPGLVRVLGGGVEPDLSLVYIEMEFVDGRSLRSIIEEGSPIEESRLRRYLLRVANVLAHAHELEWDDATHGTRMRGVVHRDVTPDNILVRREDDEAVLCDFGIAGVVEGAQRLTMSDTRVTAHRFTPPETLLEKDISPAIDLWSLAVTAYVTLTGGRYPWAGSTAPDLLRAMRTSPATPIRTHRPGVSSALEALIMSALSVDRSKRPPDAATWCRELAAMGA